MMPSRAHVWLTCSIGDKLVNNASINVGIVGATGAVGQELLRLLHDRNFPMATLRLFASARSAGKVIEYAGKKYPVDCKDSPASVCARARSTADNGT